MQIRRTFIKMAGNAALLWSAGRQALAQPTAPRIVFLSAFARADAESHYALLRPELAKLGWTDGRNIHLLAPKTSEGKNELLPAMATELVAQAPDVILVQSLPATRAAMQATKAIPIVMMFVGSPVEYGIVADYRKPGGNVTGSKYPNEEATGKLLQLLKEASPRLRSAALFINPSNEAATTHARQTQADASALGLQLQVLEVQAKGDFEAAFDSIRSAGTESIVLPPEALVLAHRDLIAGFAQKQGLLLAVVGNSRSLPASGLMAFGPVRAEYAAMTARYIDRILRGAKPGDLAIDQPTRFELTLNLKTAKALGLSLPQSLLLRADELIQ
jgi:putative tryptophan/tyrosine transport system substrate-binding protein